MLPLWVRASRLGHTIGVLSGVVLRVWRDACEVLYLNTSLPLLEPVSGT